MYTADLRCTGTDVYKYTPREKELEWQMQL
jgi:hypothetical protein